MSAWAVRRWRTAPPPVVVSGRPATLGETSLLWVRIPRRRNCCSCHLSPIRGSLARLLEKTLAIKKRRKIQRARLRILRASLFRSTYEFYGRISCGSSDRWHSTASICEYLPPPDSPSFSHGTMGPTVRVGPGECKRWRPRGYWQRWTESQQGKTRFGRQKDKTHIEVKHSVNGRPQPLAVRIGINTMKFVPLLKRWFGEQNQG